MYNQSALRVFEQAHLVLYSEIDFEQQKLMIHVNLYCLIPTKKSIS
jgi:hypothetical protein